MKLKLILSTVIFAVLSTVSINSHSQDVATHGLECVPTSLGQGLNLQQAWNQFGITNDSVEPIFGSGQGFFIICPVHTDFSFNDLFTFTVSVTGQFLENNQLIIVGGTLTPRPDITCSFLEIDGSNGVGAASIESSNLLNPIEDTGSVSGDYPTSFTSFTNVTTGAYLPGDDNFVVVCGLPPKTRITNVEINF